MCSSPFEGDGGREVVAEGLFDDEPRLAIEVDLGEPLGDGGEERRRHGEVVDVVIRWIAELFHERGEGAGL